MNLTLTMLMTTLSMTVAGAFAVQTGAAATMQPGTTAKPGAAATMQPGTATKPGAATVQPGTAVAKTPAATVQPGTAAVQTDTATARPNTDAAAVQPDTATSRSGQATEKPDTAAKPNAATVQTDTAAARSGQATAKPGAAVARPNTGAAAAKPGQAALREAYIGKYAQLAVELMVESGIPASVTLAQACLESAFGTSMLATQANNHFGIKCHGWKGEGIYKDDDAKGECFRKYDDERQSYRDHSDFLRYRDRYAFLFELDRTDYRGWAYGLKKAGYATDPEYAKRLIRIIEENGLAAYDTIPVVEQLPPSPAEAAKSVKVLPASGSKFYGISLTRQVYSRNGVMYILAESYDSYSSLADDYNLFLREILSYNDLKEEEPISAGQEIYLERKRSRAGDHLTKHVVEAGETLYGLSQRYAVRLSCLLKYNSLKASDTLREGDIILLTKPRTGK